MTATTGCTGYWENKTLRTQFFVSWHWGIRLLNQRPKDAFIFGPLSFCPFPSQFSLVQSLSHVWLFATSWTAAPQASLSITNSRSLLKLMSIESVTPSNHLILCCPLLLLPSIFPSIRVSSNESVLRIRWAKYWTFSFSISPSNEHSGLIFLGRIGWISLESKGLSITFSNTRVRKHQFFSAQLSL